MCVYVCVCVITGPGSYCRAERGVMALSTK